MAKSIYIGVDNKARKVKKLYIGVNDKARKIKKGYIGVDGVARLFYYSDISKAGTAASLSETKINLTSGQTNDYILFAGGQQDLTTYVPKGSVDAYNSSLVKTTPSNLSKARTNIANASVGNYTLFAGGSELHYTGTSFIDSNVVDAYSNTLVRTTPTALTSNAIAGVTTTEYACFNNGEMYNSSLVKSTHSNTDWTKSSPLGNYSILVSALNNRDALTIWSLNNNTLVSTVSYEAFGISSTFKGRNGFGIASVNNKYTILAGGSSTGDATGTYYDDAVAITQTLTSTIAPNLSSTRYLPCGCSTSRVAFFAGGADIYKTLSNTVDTYNETLTRQSLENLSVKRQGLASGVIQDHVLFAGGGTHTTTYTSYDTVDVYDI